METYVDRREKSKEIYEKNKEVFDKIGGLFNEARADIKSKRDKNEHLACVEYNETLQPLGYMFYTRDPQGFVSPELNKEDVDSVPEDKKPRYIVGYPQGDGKNMTMQVIEDDGSINEFEFVNMQGWYGGGTFLGS